MIHLHTIYMQVIYGVSVRLPSGSCISIQRIYVSLTKRSIIHIYMYYVPLTKQRVSDIYIATCHTYQALHCTYIYVLCTTYQAFHYTYIYICTTSHLPSNAYTRIFIHPIFLPANFKFNFFNHHFLHIFLNRKFINSTFSNN